MDWEGKSNPFRLPVGGQTDRIDGLIDLPEGIGAVSIFAHWRARDCQRCTHSRLAEASPHVGLLDGFPVDENGHPVILKIPRRDPERERQWALLKPIYLGLRAALWLSGS